MKIFLLCVTILRVVGALNCDVGTYLNNGVCSNHSMLNESQCSGGVFRYGTNSSDSRCLECVGSFLVENDSCDICFKSCKPFNMTNQTNCTGGVFLPGSNTTDSACVGCPSGTFEKFHNNTCYNWSYYNQQDCLNHGNRGIYYGGDTSNDSYCLPCVSGTGKGYVFEGVCRECIGLKNHFHSLNCCRDQFKKPQFGIVTPFRDVCQFIIDAWKKDCDQYCFV